MNNKLILFILTTVLFILALTLKTADHALLIVLYIIFVLVGLYDLGKNETNE